MVKDKKGSINRSMDDKKAVAILIRLLEKHSFSDEEKEALASAIGILSWTALGKSRVNGLVKARKNKVHKSTQWKTQKFNAGQIKI